MDCSRFREDMLDVLYGEADRDVASRFEAHRASCADCEDELSGFQGVRRDLQAWRYEAPRPRRRFMPGVRGLAAAASIALAFGGGLALARAEVSYRQGELLVRFGAPAAPRENPVDVAQQFARLEAEHRADLQSVKAALAQQPEERITPETLLQRMEEMIRESEGRQAMMMQAGLNELAARTAAQRGIDMRQISTSLSQLELQTSTDVQRLSQILKDWEKK